MPAVNENHQRLCPSEGWAAYLQGEVLPSLAALAPFGDDVLEIGPGPGAATEWLRHRARRVTAIELDEQAAGRLRTRFAGTNVHVDRGDATTLPYADDAFDAVGCFTMLHHVPTLRGQQAIVGEALRVLRPGGALLASDSLASPGLHEFHEGDTYNPLDPAVLVVMLRSLGFERVTLRIDDSLQFVAHKPAPIPADDDQCHKPERTDTP